MGEATYRWVCTYCDASDLAESPEMAKLAVDVHVSLFHGPAREGIRTHGEPDGSVLAQQAGGSATTEAMAPRANHLPGELPVSALPSRASWWHALVNLMRYGRRR
jgi:hypothetical protein